MAASFYIYAFIDGHEILYVGKGSGGRLKRQQKRFGVEGRVIERLDDERLAYEREAYCISQLRPTLNKNRGGAGAFRTKVIPSELKGKLTLEQWKREESRAEAETRKIERIGLRKYAASMLLRFVDERNCDTHGVSKVDVFRLREVANGPRC